MIDVGVVPVADMATVEARVRAQVEEELRGKHEADTNRRIDEALVKYHGREASLGRGAGGRFQLDDNFAAYAQRGVLSESWLPVVCQLGAGEELTEATVKRGLDNYLSGFPLVESNSSTGATGVGSQERLLKAMRSADQKALIDPHATAIVTTYKNYIVGQGVRVGCPHNEAIDRVVKEYWRRNRMPPRIKDAVGRKITTGEHFFFHFVDPNTGLVTTRDPAKPWEISDIESHEEDAETRLAYGRQVADGYHCKTDWYADIDYYQQRDTLWGERSAHDSELAEWALVQMIKSGSLSSLRGITPLYPILRYLKYLEDFITDRVILNHERSKVVWVKVLKGAQDTESSRADVGPQGGQVLIETPLLEWKAVNANINASGATDDARMLRMVVSTGVQMPEVLLYQDASQAVYSSMRSHDTPWAQSVRSKQDDWRWDVGDTLRVVIRESVRRNRLPTNSKQQVVTLEAWNGMYDEVSCMITEGAHAAEVRNVIRETLQAVAKKVRIVPTEEIDLDIKFPDPVQEDPLAQAQRAEVLHRIHVASLPEIADWVGLDWNEQNQKQQRAGGWPEPGTAADATAKTGGKKTDSKPGETTTDKPREYAPA